MRLLLWRKAGGLVGILAQAVPRSRSSSAALVVSHDRYCFERFADVVLAIEGGRLVRL
jgi:ATPase subunit of ABC transporter with duplicated ATPase domains